MTIDSAPIRITNIIHHFDEKQVLAGVSYAFTRNKVTAILGKSGDGKTTLLQVINGMVVPDSGEVMLFGQPIDYGEIHKLRLKMGYVVQQVGLFPHLDIQANITLLGKISGQSNDEMTKRMSHLMEMVGLPSIFAAKYPHQLSGGEQQRVGLCRAMFLNPPVLLMDEPFASLDYGTKHSIYNYLVAIQQNEPRTVVIVTHDKEEAVKLADYFLLMDAGKIRETGDTTTLQKIHPSYAAPS